MLGAIIGDIVGSRFEFNNYRHKDFDFFTDQCVLTDDSIMTLAVSKAIFMSQPDYRNLSKNVWTRNFRTKNPGIFQIRKPYNS